MAARRHREQPYLSLNPYGRVPTLEEDGFVLFESTAILNYLEAMRPTPPLVPADVRGRALVDMHKKLCCCQLAILDRLVARSWPSSSRRSKAHSVTT
jgi:glutathione S-transferase